MTSTATAEAAVDLAAELVGVDSVNPGLVPGAAGEAAIVELLASRLADDGFAVQIVHAAGSDLRPSLIATHTGTGGGRSLLLNGHLDTVGVSGMSDPFAATIVGGRHTGRLYGRGACDMKGGVAAMVAAAQTAARQGSAGDIIVALVADEEHASCGTEAVLERLAGRLPDACLVGEPTGLDLAVAHRGYAVVEVEFTGRAAHSAQPELGINAVTHLGRLLAAIAGTGSLMATVVAGGSSPFLIPATASAVIECRTVPGELAAECLVEVRRILREMHRDDPTVHATATMSLSREAWRYDPDDPAGAALSAALSGALGAHRGFPPESVAMPYWMESAMWEAAGVPTVVCGPSGDGLHAAEEWVDLAQVRSYADSLVQAIRAFCGPDPVRIQ